MYIWFQLVRAWTRTLLTGKRSVVSDWQHAQSMRAAAVWVGCWVLVAMLWSACLWTRCQQAWLLCTAAAYHLCLATLTTRSYLCGYFDAFLLVDPNTGSLSTARFAPRAVSTSPMRSEDLVESTHPVIASQGPAEHAHESSKPRDHGISPFTSAPCTARGRRFAKFHSHYSYRGTHAW